jgi:hypothetical protein
VNEDEKNYEKIIKFRIDFEVENGGRIWKVVFQISP